MTHKIQNDPMKVFVLSQSLLEFQIKICYACFPRWNLGQMATALTAIKKRGEMWKLNNLREEEALLCQGSEAQCAPDSTEALSTVEIRPLGHHK